MSDRPISRIRQLTALCTLIGAVVNGRLGACWRTATNKGPSGAGGAPRVTQMNQVSAGPLSGSGDQALGASAIPFFAWP